MICLNTGATLDKELCPRDFCSPKLYGVKTKEPLETFHPCKFCITESCKFITYDKCIKAYYKLWKEKYPSPPVEFYTKRESPTN